MPQNVQIQLQSKPIQLTPEASVSVNERETTLMPSVSVNAAGTSISRKKLRASYGAVDYERPPTSIEADRLEMQHKRNRELKRALFRHWRALDHIRIVGIHFVLLLYYFGYIILYGFHFSEVYDHDNNLNTTGFSLSGGQIAVVTTFSTYLLVTLTCVMFIPIGVHRFVHQVVSLCTAILLPMVIWLNFVLDENFIYFDNDCVWVSLFPGLLCAVFLQLTLWPDRSVLFTAVAVLWSMGHVLLAAWIASFHQNTKRIVMQLAAQLLILTGTVIVAMYNNVSITKRRAESCHSLSQAVDRRTILQYEKERQEQLLLSIIPAHLAAQVKKKMTEGASENRTNGKQKKPNKLFHDLHVQLHENVSILFADIVNFTPLTASMTPKQLVKTLNDLYSKFDQLAQDLQCMRIKILGDCYYCVSGMPINRPNHADNIVQMGLAMIEIIKSLREASGIDVDMRIGVHTGSVLCGILGLRKWQFDIWSDDVTLANCMESGGRPGKVHITKTTRDQLSGEYIIKDAETDEVYVLSHGEQTYWIIPESVLDRTKSFKTFEMPTPESDDGTRLSPQLSRTINRIQSLPNGCYSGQLSVSDVYLQHRLSTHSGSSMIAPRAAKMSKAVESWGVASAPFANLSRRRSSDRIREASMTLIENNLTNFSLNNVRFFGQSTGHPLTWYLRYRDDALATSFNPFVKQTFATEALVLIGIGFGMGAFDALLPAQSVTITSVLIAVTLVVCLCNGAITVLFVTPGVKNHMVLSLLSLVIFLLCTSLSIGPQFLQTLGECIEPALNLPACLLHVLAMTVLGSVPFNARAITLVCLAWVQAVTLISTPPCAKIHSNQSIYQHQTAFEHTDYVHSTFWNVTVAIHIVLATLVALFICWLGEYEQKAQWACLSSFRNEQEDVQTMQDVNNLLIENILPSHVGQYFLGPDKPLGELYYESHESVCVMFASIPNFKDFWSEWDVSRKLECLRLLNEIICEFDKLLSKPKFSVVEKIKTVSSTYMAASGLKPSPFKKNEDRSRYCVTMLDFVFGMHNLLEQINKDSFQSFRLRVGLSFGPLVAGVIGAQKPMYDIWGNTVNLASRMDSHGEMGKIHVTPEAAEALMQNGYSLESRGKIKVKGVHEPIETFFAVLDYKPL